MLRRKVQLTAAMAAIAGVAFGGVLWLKDGSLSQERERPPAAAFADLLELAEQFPYPDDLPLNWPRDHGAHLDQFAEYWLFAGLLVGSDERRYGFQLAMFRIALQPDKAERESAWATRDIYRAYLVIAADDALHITERQSRAALGLSGAGDQPVSVWLENWQVEYDEEAATFDLEAPDAAHRIKLRLALPAVEPYELAGPGHRGYWAPGLEAEGELTLEGRSVSVTGGATLDRIWGRALPFGSGQVALTRVWLELDDGAALRCGQLRRRAGGGTPVTECILRQSDGISRRFDSSQVALEPVREGWQEVRGTQYPLNWRLELPALDLKLRIAPFGDIQAQFSLPGWSGIVHVNGASAGWGLLELSNYAGP
jgi:predicted secreted hydrolase